MMRGHIKVKREYEYAMSPWIFNIFFDRVVRQVNEGVRREGEVKLRDERSRGWKIK